MKRTAVALVLLAGCSASEAPSKYTYWRDIKPVMDAKCSVCHSDGGIAPFAFDGYADAQSHKEEINVAVSNRVMPPWLAAKGCNDYVGDRSLSDDQIAMFTDWIAAGAKEGKQSDYVAGRPDTSRSLSRV